jgi:hypothetical protein
MPQDTCANEPVNATNPQVEPLPAAIREGEDEFIVSNIAGGGTRGHCAAISIFRDGWVRRSRKSALIGRWNRTCGANGA